MANESGKAYALSILSPIKNGSVNDRSYTDSTREAIRKLELDENSPFARIPQTYTARIFILDDVRYESLPGADRVFYFSEVLSIFFDSIRTKVLPKEDHLKSKYIAFSSNFHGSLDSYLEGMWNNAGEDVAKVWQNCYGFENVKDAASFKTYMKKCQLDVTLFFNGSTDDSLPEQLKGLYLKQELAKFATANQGKSAEELQQAYKEFDERVQPKNLAQTSWQPGQSSL